MQLGACTWSIDRDDPVNALRIIGCELGLRVAQVGLFGATAVRDADVEAIRNAAIEADVHIVGFFVGFDGEDYSSIKHLADTGGFAPDTEYPDRLRMVLDVADRANALSCRDMIVHAGTVPESETGTLYEKLVKRTVEVLSELEQRGWRLLLETGRESAKTLARFLEDVGSANVAVNFDSGNFVVMSTDNPPTAVNVLRDHVAGVHLKDAVASSEGDASFGRPAPLGAGDAQIPRVLSKLRIVGYDGPLLIECQRDIGGATSVGLAADYVRSMLG